MALAGRQIKWLIWVGLGLTSALLLAAFWVTTLIGGARAKPLPVLGQVADFTLTNQAARAVSLSDLKGSVWVADIIFTRCAGPCLTMTRQMKELQQALPAGSNARLISLTTDPDFDTPAVLERYAERFGVDPRRWWFLTGTKKAIGDLAIQSLKLTAIEKKPEERQSPADLFVHSTILVVIDKQGQLRGIYETSGEGVDPAQTRREILAAVQRLGREP